jgi:hypothetical protein
MIVLTFDPLFKYFSFIQNYVGFDLTMHVVTKYDHEIFMPLLMAIYNYLTPTFVNVKVVGFVTL